MVRSIAAVERFQVGTLKVEIHPTREAAGEAAAQAAADVLHQLGRLQKPFGVIFATGASQFDMLDCLTRTPDLPWNRARGFHLDEYVGIAPDHPASFRKYLRDRLTAKVPLGEFNEIDGSDPNPEQVCRTYAQKLRDAAPSLCLLGIGENGHLAFNEPGIADFQDPVDVKLVHLNTVSREQQVAEGWFPSVAESAEQAITVTIPALFRVPRLIVSVPGTRKAQIIPHTLADDISPRNPSTILRTHPNATLYLDHDSAAGLDGFLPQ